MDHPLPSRIVMFMNIPKDECNAVIYHTNILEAEKKIKKVIIEGVYMTMSVVGDDIQQ